jgi:hypothetical protein
MLNAPVVRTADAGSTPSEVDNPLRGSAGSSFEWGQLGLEAAGKDQPRGDSSVRPASFVGEISDAN